MLYINSTKSFIHGTSFPVFSTLHSNLNQGYLYEVHYLYKHAFPWISNPLYLIPFTDLCPLL